MAFGVFRVFRGFNIICTAHLNESRLRYCPGDCGRACRVGRVALPQEGRAMRVRLHMSAVLHQVLRRMLPRTRRKGREMTIKTDMVYHRDTEAQRHRGATCRNSPCLRVSEPLC